MRARRFGALSPAMTWARYAGSVFRRSRCVGVFFFCHALGCRRRDGYRWGDVSFIVSGALAWELVGRAVVSFDADGPI